MPSGLTATLILSLMLSLGVPSNIAVHAGEIGVNHRLRAQTVGVAYKQRNDKIGVGGHNRMVDGKCVEINGNFLLAGSKSVVGILEHKLGVAEGNRAFRAGLADLSSRRICADGAVRYQCVAAFYVVEHKLIGVGVIGDLVAALIFVRQSVLCYHIACLSFHLGVNGVETGILVGKFHLAHDGSETFLRFGKQIIGGHAELDCAAVYNGLVHKTGE